MSLTTNETRTSGSGPDANTEETITPTAPGTGSGERRIRFHPEVDVVVTKHASSEFVTKKVSLAEEKNLPRDSRYHRKNNKPCLSTGTRRTMALMMGLLIMAVAGTMYCFNAYSQALRSRLKINNQTQANLIVSIGNIGLAIGFTGGAVFDWKGPKWTAFVAAVLSFIGYFMMYINVTRTTSPVFGTYIFSACSLFVVGQGSNFAYSAALQTQLLNFPPHHRGKAVGLIDGLYGASAAIFSTIYATTFGSSSNVDDQNLAGFFLFLASVLASVNILGVLVLQRVPWVEDPVDEETTATPPGTTDEQLEPFLKEKTINASKVYAHGEEEESNGLDVTGLALMKLPSFWLNISIFGLTGGLGLIFTNNIGYIIGAMQKPASVTKTMSIIIPVASCLGRLISGLLSDMTMKWISRTAWQTLAIILIGSAYWLLAFKMSSNIAMGVACALLGTGFGTLNSISPTHIGDSFGVPNFGKNWGTIILASASFAFIFQIIVGKIYQRHAVTIDSSSVCYGVNCYQASLMIAGGILLFVFVLSIINVIRTKKKSQWL
eukprot:TRINITY_DN1828_c0_g3_i1.p1 TRINITY_DN1828_c0_g3~~TRINITY_DN1828_c0_g3_i1.p1  ORF type:complete len:548 (-),score=96.92 TRINITY_DN1828_c0_g3_i1:16-1659(-)